MGFVPRPNTRSYVGVLKGASRCKKGRAMLIGKKVKGVNEEMHRRSQRGKVGRKLRFEPRFLNAYLRCYRDDVEGCLDEFKRLRGGGFIGGGKKGEAMGWHGVIWSAGVARR